MKQTLMTAETLILFALIILFPGVILEGAQAGLLLWFNTVLPALLPFLILSNLLLGSPAIHGPRPDHRPFFASPIWRL